MNKIFTLLSLITIGNTITAQTLLDETFNTYTLGAINGQNSYVSMVTAPNATEIVANGRNSTKGLKLAIAYPLSQPAGQNSVSTNKPGLNAAWLARNASNNVLNIEYDLYTGGNSLSSIVSGNITNLANSTTATSEAYGMLMVHGNKQLKGVTIINGTPTQISLGLNTADVSLPANTWVRIGYSYDKNTGTIRFKGPGFDKTIPATAGQDLMDGGFGATDIPGLPNFGGAEFIYDNILIYASSTSQLLHTNETTKTVRKLSISPNPATDILMISTKETLPKTAYIYDLSGIRSEINITNKSIPIKHLPAGTYILGLKTSTGFESIKFIKK